jgi:hypothetical protein
MAKSPQEQGLSGYENSIEHVRPADKGFLWYMVVHFLMSSNTERSTKADGKTYEELQRVVFGRGNGFLVNVADGVVTKHIHVRPHKRRKLKLSCQKSKEKNCAPLLFHEVESDRYLKSMWKLQLVPSLTIEIRSET